jgi:tRNA-2-methylthio-N6-dimethylallyladenosine synthase
MHIPHDELKRQIDIMRRVRESLSKLPEPPLAYVDPYGCQQNESDSEKLRGMLAERGYGMTDDEFLADVIVINTCAIRENAENRVFGNVGALVHTKRAKPTQVIALCGCMAGIPEVVEKIRESYEHVDLVFSPHALWRFPELLQHVLPRGATPKRRRQPRLFDDDTLALGSDGAIAEGLPLLRDRAVKAWLPIMYGCDNYCSYCIVPYVRGRERSREPSMILDEARGLVAGGYKDITLLGQNVNSYCGAFEGSGFRVQGSMVRSQGSTVKSRGAVVRAQGSVVRVQGSATERTSISRRCSV